MDDFEDFLSSPLATPAKSSTVSAAKSVPINDDGSFFLDDDVSPLKSSAAVVIDKLAPPTSTPDIDDDIFTDAKPSQINLKGDIGDIANKSLTNGDDDLLSALRITEKSPNVSKVDFSTPSKLPVSAKAINTKDDDDFDDLFGETTPLSRTITKVQPVNLSDAQTLTVTEVALNLKNEFEVVEGKTDATIEESSSVAVIEMKEEAKEIASADLSPLPAYSTEFEELFGDSTPTGTANVVKAEDSVVAETKVELLSKFDETIKGSVQAEVPSPAAPGTSSSVKKESTDDDLDFLSWLGDTTTPIKSPTALTTPAPAEKAVKFMTDVVTDSGAKKPYPLHRSSSSDGGMMSPTHSQTKVKALMDIFFDDLFGGQERPAEEADRVVSKVKMSCTEFETKVKEFAASSFADVPMLRSLLLEGGYVPPAYRAQVWCVLLTGSCSSSDDPELHDAQRLSALTTELSHHSSLLADCEAMAIKSDSTGSFQQDLHDILVLFCTRRERDYSPVLCQLLAPLLLAPSAFSKEMASSCFYSLASEFFPLLSLDRSSLDAGLGTVHSWLRLLVVYHSPAVAQHLDRAMPGWERATSIGLHTEATHSETLTETETETENENDNDAEIGGEDDSPWTDKGGKKEKEKEKEPWGIPLHWICGMFSGSVPAEQSCFLLDWAIISKQRYAGALITMTGDDIRAWLVAVSIGQTDWFKLLPLCLPHPLSTVEFALVTPVLTWEEFTCGWVHAATVLQLSTPVAFQEALRDTEKWATSRTYGTAASEGRANSGDSCSSDAPIDPEASHTQPSDFKLEMDRNGSAFSGMIHDDSMSPMESPTHSTPQCTSDSQTKGKEDGEGQGKGLLDRFKLLSSKIFTSTATPHSAFGSGSEYKNSKWPHDSKVEADTMCVWSSAGEVVPFISSSSRAALSPFESIQFHFQQGVLAVSEAAECEDGPEAGRMTLPPLTELSCQGELQDPPVQCVAGVTFFGIDCRNETERTLGLFPRTYCIDPSFMTDTDHISKLLVTLEPLASSLHLCIIGAGDDYFRATYQPHRQGKLQELDSLQSVIADDRARLNAVAMFFLKRAFPHVSLLDGGFVGAVKHLREEDPTRSLSTVLADPCVPVLEAVLGYNGSGVVVVPVPGAAVLSLAARIRQSVVGQTSSSGAEGSQQRTLPVSNGAPAPLGSIMSMASSMLKTPVRGLDLGHEDAGAEESGSSKSASPAPVPDSDGSVSAHTDPTLPDAPSSTSVPPVPIPVPVPPMAAAASYFGGFGKKMTAFGASSLESVRINIAAAQLAHQQQQEVAKQQAHQPNTEKGAGAGAMLWTNPDMGMGMGGSSSSSSSKVEGGGLGFMVGLRSAIASKISTARGATGAGGAEDKVIVPLGHTGTGSTFVIDEEEDGDGDGDDGMGPRDEVDPQKICVSKTDLERAQALAMHVLAGLKKGETISISRESLPGAVLFPGIKYKEYKEPKVQGTVEAEVEGVEGESQSQGQGGVGDEQVDGEDSGVSAPSTPKSDTQRKDFPTPSSPTRATPPTPPPTQVHRFLVVTRERFIVLDSGGSGIGSSAVVKSNHHLTELLKMTFRKSDPELICLYLGSEGKMRQYRVSRRKEFVDALQKNMQRFK